MSSAGSASNINNNEENDLKDEEEIGRVAGWAANFEKLLKDGAGIVIFTVRIFAI
jgi:hypothetical protein